MAVERIKTKADIILSVVSERKLTENEQAQIIFQFEQQLNSSMEILIQIGREEMSCYPRFHLHKEENESIDEKELKDIEDCLNKLDSKFSDDDKRKIKEMNEDSFSANFHHGFGIHIRNDFKLWDEN